MIGGEREYKQRATLDGKISESPWSRFEAVGSELSESVFDGERKRRERINGGRHLRESRPIESEISESQSIESKVLRLMDNNISYVAMIDGERGKRELTVGERK